MSNMIRSVGSMTRWPWDGRTPDVVQLPSSYGISMKFLRLRSGPGLMTKQVVWTIAEIFDILVEHDRYSIGTFQVNSNWDDDTIAFGSIAVAAPALVLANMIDPSPMDEPESTSRIVPVNHVSNGQTSNTQLSASNQSSYSEANEDVKLYLIYPEAGAIYQDVQIYNATIKVLIKLVEEIGLIWPMVATYNDINNFTLSVRSVSVEKGHELTGYQAAKTLAWFPMSTERWGEQSGIITVNGKPRGILCIDKGDRMDFFTSTRCAPKLDTVPEDGVAAERF